MRTTRLATLLVLVASALLSACGGPELSASATATPTAQLLGDGPVTLTGVAGPAGEQLAVKWTVAKRPEGSQAEIAGADGATATITPDAVGAYELIFTVQESALRTGGGIASRLEGRKAVSATVQIEVATRPAARLAWVVQPSDITAGAPITPAVSLEVQNDRGERVPTAAPEITLTLTKPDGSDATLLGTPRATASEGKLSFADLSVDRVGTYTLSASAPGFTSALSEAFDVTAAEPALDRATFTATPTTARADGVASIALLLTLHDRFGNPTPNVSSTITASGTQNDLQTEREGITDAKGQVQATLRSTRAEAKVATAAFTGHQLTADVTFTPGPPAQDQSLITCAPESAVANGVDPITCLVTLRDQFGNAVPGALATAEASGSGNTLTPDVLPGTDADGTVAFQLTSTRAEGKTITVLVDDVTLTDDATFVPGPPDLAHSTFTAAPSTVTADGVEAATLTVTLRDAFDNPVPNTPVGFSLSGTGNTVSDAAVTTDAAGVATTTVRSTKAEEKTAAATFGEGLAREAAVTFISGGASAANSDLTANPTTLVADDTAFSTITATLRDSSGNPVAGTPVAFSSTGSQNTLSAASAITDAAGVAQITLKSKIAEVKTITATFGSAQTKSVDVTFTAGAPVATTSTFTAAPATVVANNTATSTLTATLKDANGNVVPNATVNFSVSGTGNTLSATSAVTNASGVASVTVRSTKAEVKTATATFGTGQSKTASITFTAEAAGAANSTLVANPTTVVADDVATTTLTATIRDANNNPVPNTAVAFTATGTQNTFSAPSATTNASGVASVTLKSKTAEVKTITATFGASLTKQATVTFVAGEENAAQSSLSAAPASVLADNSATTTITATIKDAFGNPVAGSTVSFAVSGSGNTLSAASAATNASGVATVTLRSSVAEVKTITATFGSAQTKTTTVTFTAGAPIASQSLLTAAPTTVVADNVATSTLTATLKDQFGNVVPNATVNFSVNGSGNTLSAASAVTNASGVAAVTVRSTKAEVKTATATFGTAQTKTATVTFVTGAAASGRSSLVANPTTVVANDVATTTLTVTLRDAFDNAVAGATVGFGSSGTQNTFSATSAVTNDSGVAAVTLRSRTAEEKTITASFGTGQTLTATVIFTAGPADGAQSTFVASPSSVAADNVATSSLVATLKDQFGNPVGGTTVGFSVSGSLNTLSATSATTSTSGVASVTVRSSKAEAKTATATFGSLSKTAPVTFTVGAPVANNSTLTASPTALPADNASASTITATIADTMNNRVPGVTVTFSATGSGNTFSATSAVTNASGVAAVTLRSNLSGTKTVTATFGSAQTRTVDVTFTCTDLDGDGYGPNCALGPDCDDERSSVNPGRIEVCQNGLDDDCNPATSDICPVSCPPSGCGVGCADGQREAFTNQTLFPFIAACAGGFQVPGTFYETPARCSRAAGDDGSNTSGAGCSAEDLCAQGWHVCKTTAEVRAKVPVSCQTGMSSSTCGAGFPASSFFVARQSGSGCASCSTSPDPTQICGGADVCSSSCYPTSDQTNDLFGGGTTGGQATNPNCGPLDKTSGNYCGNLPAPWACGYDPVNNPAGLSESLVVTKAGPGGGGVLCCID